MYDSDGIRQPIPSATLSATARLHLKAAREAPSLACIGATASSGSDTSMASAYTNSTGDQQLMLQQLSISEELISHTQFTVFPKLPVELRLKIWHSYTALNPRKVQLICSWQNQDETAITRELNGQLILRQVNHEARASTFGPNGSVYLRLPYPKYVTPSCTGSGTCSFLFNPAFDMLYINDIHKFRCGDLLAGLRTCNALDKITCLAINMGHQLFQDYMVSFREYLSLELVFVVCGQRFERRRPGFNLGDMVGFRVLEESAQTPTKDLAARLAEQMAGGVERVAPRVVFVTALVH